MGTALFHTICILASLGATSYCIYKYILDEDVSNITYQQFGAREEDKYPTVSFCFYGDIIFDGKEMQSLMNMESKATTINELHNEYENLISRYKSILVDENSNDEMKNISYENVTIDIRDYLKELQVTSSDNVKIYHWKSGTS